MGDGTKWRRRRHRLWCHGEAEEFALRLRYTRSERLPPLLRALSPLRALRAAAATASAHPDIAATHALSGGADARARDISSAARRPASPHSFARPMLVQPCIDRHRSLSSRTSPSARLPLRPRVHRRSWRRCVLLLRAWFRASAVRDVAVPPACAAVHLISRAVALRLATWH